MKQKVKLACMTWIYNEHSFERSLGSIARAGYRYVSFGLPHEGKPAFDDGAAGEATRIIRLLERYGLKPVTLVSTDVLAPGRPIKLALQRMAFAQAIGAQELLSLGTTSYRNFPGEPLTDEEMKPINEAFAAKFREVGEEAGKHGLIVTIKPHTGNTASANIIADTLRTIGSPHVKASYDPGNVRFYEGIEPSADLPVIAEQTVSFIAKDHKGERSEADFPIPGQGDVDFPAMFATLYEAGFAGPVVVERLDGADGSFGAGIPISVLDERVAKARVNLERMLQEAGFEI
ncbi:sugar phosphate isomerase/epimerase family protein [Cohnella silvisoli]|uniref:Sugar phosphate isomerase/epimerase n=1 Tax=Cohnella silvisoli TaxID=2873699 RepID=A0ABV1KWS0_9BACL|nr:sugar phosphate isomerase/epimerase [Cohnella silvisoli]MCD9023852.1 sugar phosphate isomerase/epimerase [Cohnella silvisoli]